MEYCFVLDSRGNPLAPTKVAKGWFLVRKKRAKLISKQPMVIQLKKPVDLDEDTHFVCGIDDGSKHVGIAVVQQGATLNKVVFKGTIEHRNDVKKLMEVRRGYRKFHRYHKRHREARFSNRASSRSKGRLAPTIKQKRDAVIRTITWLAKWVPISEYHLEDVAVDIRALTTGYKPYKWQYQKATRLDENIRKATLFRDNCTCKECGRKNCRLEVHHITAKRYGGSNTLDNLITLCANCHQKTEGHERDFEDHYYAMINGGSARTDFAQHVMQGKTYIRSKLASLGVLHLTTGGATANARIDLGIEKSHSNDAIVITGLVPDTTNVRDWVIKPMRRQSKTKTDNVLGIRTRDYVSYTFTNGMTYYGYVTSLQPKRKSISFRAPEKTCCCVNASKCRLLWRFNKIYWF